MLTSNKLYIINHYSAIRPIIIQSTYIYKFVAVQTTEYFFAQMAGITENGRRIMVAIDEGEESIYALTWCLKNLVFQNSKDHLILLYVKPPRVVYSAFDGTGKQNFMVPKNCD